MANRSYFMSEGQNAENFYVSTKLENPKSSVERKELTTESIENVPDFIDDAGKLSVDECKLIVEQALVLLGENYVHLQYKKSLYGTDPIQKLRLIYHELAQASDEARYGFDFHREMLEVFNSLRDLHTNYLLPQQFANKVAYLPFQIEEYFISQKPHYIVTRFTKDFAEFAERNSSVFKHFKEGVEIKKWNGMPIERAIDISARMHAGGNRAARHVRGLDGLTLRSLRTTLPPDEMWVTIDYIPISEENSGNLFTIKVDWSVIALTSNSTTSRSTDEFQGTKTEDISSTQINGEYAIRIIEGRGFNERILIQEGQRILTQGIDLEAYIVQQAKSKFFKSAVIENFNKIDGGFSAVYKSKGFLIEVLEETKKSHNFLAIKINDDVGYIRIFNFEILPNRTHVDFVNEFCDLLSQMPDSSLIIDVRGNGGGSILAGEGILQTLTCRSITPEPAQFINTDLNLRICHKARSYVGSTEIPGLSELQDWIDSMNGSVKTGAVYSQGFSITSPEFSNSIGQKFYGNTLLITDARCYSATDVFIAGFKDHNIGEILGVDDNIGAGGGNVWNHSVLKFILDLPGPFIAPTPYKLLPAGVDMRVAIRRTLRVGSQAGSPLEDMGVRLKYRHFMTKDDLLNGNIDLLARAVEILQELPRRKFKILTKKRVGKELYIRIETQGITHIIEKSDHPTFGKKIIGDGENELYINISPKSSSIELQGYDGDELIVSKIINNLQHPKQLDDTKRIIMTSLDPTFNLVFDEGQFVFVPGVGRVSLGGGQIATPVLSSNSGDDKDDKFSLEKGQIVYIPRIGRVRLIGGQIATPALPSNSGDDKDDEFSLKEGQTVYVPSVGLVDIGGGNNIAWDDDLRRPHFNFAPSALNDGQVVYIPGVGRIVLSGGKLSTPEFPGIHDGQIVYVPGRGLVRLGTGKIEALRFNLNQWEDKEFIIFNLDSDNPKLERAIFRDGTIQSTPVGPAQLMDGVVTIIPLRPVALDDGIMTSAPIGPISIKSGALQNSPIGSANPDDVPITIIPKGRVVLDDGSEISTPLANVILKDRTIQTHPLGPINFIPLTPVHLTNELFTKDNEPKLKDGTIMLIPLNRQIRSNDGNVDNTPIGPLQLRNGKIWSSIPINDGPVVIIPITSVTLSDGTVSSTPMGPINVKNYMVKSNLFSPFNLLSGSVMITPLGTLKLTNGEDLAVDIPLGPIEFKDGEIQYTDLNYKIYSNENPFNPRSLASGLVGITPIGRVTLRNGIKDEEDVEISIPIGPLYLEDGKIRIIPVTPDCTYNRIMNGTIALTPLAPISLDNELTISAAIGPITLANGIIKEIKSQIIADLDELRINKFGCQEFILSPLGHVTLSDGTVIDTHVGPVLWHKNEILCNCSGPATLINGKVVITPLESFMLGGNEITAPIGTVTVENGQIQNSPLTDLTTQDDKYALVTPLEPMTIKNGSNNSLIQTSLGNATLNKGKIITHKSGPITFAPLSRMYRDSQSGIGSEINLKDGSIILLPLCLDKQPITPIGPVSLHNGIIMDILGSSDSFNGQFSVIPIGPVTLDNSEETIIRSPIGPVTVVTGRITRTYLQPVTLFEGEVIITPLSELTLGDVAPKEITALLAPIRLKAGKIESATVAYTLEGDDQLRFLDPAKLKGLVSITPITPLRLNDNTGPSITAPVGPLMITNGSITSCPI